MLRYRAEPCGRGDNTNSWRVVDAELTPEGTGICECSLRNARDIAHALNFKEVYMIGGEAAVHEAGLIRSSL